MAKKNHDTDVAFIEALAKLLQENDLTELEVMRDYGENDSLNVRVSRAKEVVQQIAAPVAAAPAPAAPAAAPAAEAPAAASNDPASHPRRCTLANGRHCLFASRTWQPRHLSTWATPCPKAKPF